MKKVMFTAFAVGLCMTANVIAQVPSYVPANGLVGWWPFNGNANDESGNGNNGTVNGATLTTDRNGVANKAYSFDGVNDRIGTLPLIINQNFTASIWCNLGNNLFQYPLGLGINNITQDGIGLGFSGNSPSCVNVPSNRFFAFDGVNSPCNNILNSNNVSTTNTWVNIILVKNGATTTLYKNGLLEVSNNVLNLNINSLTFGVRSDLIFFFNGKLDDIGLWNRALTQQEITDLFNANSCSNDLTISPTTNTQNIGGNSTFTAVTSDANPTYYWQSDFGQGYQTLSNYGDYSGTNTNMLTISNVQLTNHNQPIRAISTSGNCSDTSNVANIQITDTCITNVTVYDTLLTTVTDTLIINTTLSLPAPNNANTILIYPNPASDHITIDNGNFAAMAGYTIKIENNAGQQVFQSLINQAQFYVDLSTWSGNGLYFVHLIDAQGNTVTVRKIVLQ